MTISITKSIAHILAILMLLVLPYLGWGQTTIVNYDFNSATSYATATAATASGVSSVLTSSESFVSASTGTPTGNGAFATNANGPALSMNSYSGSAARYFQFSLAGAALPKYSAFKVYFQGYRSPAAAVTLTLQYSLDGTNYTSFGAVYTPGAGSFTEVSYDLSGVSVLSTLSNLSFRLLTSTNTSGTLRIDNFQVQAVNTVDPLIASLNPSVVEAGSADLALTVTGSNFKLGAVVSFNGQNLATTYNSATSLVSMVPAANIATTGSYPVVVTNPGATSSPATTLTVTPALVHWTGPAGPGSWFDASNWSTGTLPTATDEVVLDHRYVAGSFTVILDQNVAVSIKSLTVNPGAGDSIFVLVPPGNTVSPAALMLGSPDATPALKIYNKGVVTNASGLTANAGIDVVGTAATFFLYNGGSYRQASSAGHKQVAENLSAIAGTEQGIFDFRLPGNVTGSYTLSVANRTYGTLIFRNRPGQASTSYPGSANSLVVRGKLLIGPGAVVTATINTTNEVQLLGDVLVQGTLLFKNGSSGAPSQVITAGASPQTIKGTISFEPGIGFTVNNPAGATLATPLSLSGQLALISGILTTTATNLLTLSPTASVMGGSATSYINGPLARQTATGALSNLVFPVGSGAGYRPVTLNATAQDATTYLVTPKEGPAADPTNLLAGTSALPTLTRVSRRRSVNITPTPATTFSGTVTLSFGADDSVNQPGDASFTIGKNSNSAGWQNIGVSNGGVVITTAATPTSGTSGTITSQPFTSFSDFALASISADAAINPLPVVLTSFVARRQAADVRLSWTTAAELYNARFDVQRSLDGQLFTTVASVAGQGTTALARQYTALDLVAPTAVLYYRLAQVDTDGHTTFSPVVALAGTTATVPYPNPARDRLVVPAPAGTQVRVLDLMGRVLQSAALPPSGEVSVASLPVGVYLLQLGEGAQTLRFSKE